MPAVDQPGMIGRMFAKLQGLEADDGSAGSRPRARWVSAAAIAAWVALGACSSNTVVPGGPCVTNRDCPTTEVCISAKCTPVATKKCTGDNDCAADQYCDADGACKPRETVLCTTDEACPATQRCNTTTGVCITGARSCSSDAQCASINKRCNTMINQCVDCVDASQCPSGLACSGGTCVDPGTPTACAGDFTCGPPSRICDRGQCVPGCNATSCAQGQACDTTTGRCMAVGTSCTGDAQCGAPIRVCEGAQCVSGCAQPGGLTCAGGTICDPSTGRCVNPNPGCSTDAQCGPPARVCETGQCVPGCGQSGGVQCSGATTCDTTSGRCVPIQMTGCTTDAQCGAPVGVCEAGQCVPGCGEIGGLTCSGNTVCSATSGRCTTGGGGNTCSSDAQCGAPANICQNTQCTPGCSVTGCAGGQTCNASTGRCTGGGGGGTGLALDANCLANADCASKACFDLGSPVGARCVQSCGSSADCPSGFTCYDFNGAKMCLSASVFSGSATFARGAGQACAVGGECRSNYCDQTQRRCIETCTDDGDCGGAGCRFAEVASDIFASSCLGPLGPTPNGGSCTNVTDCQSGICAGNVCREACSSVADCANGEVCGFLDASVCAIGIISCLRWIPNFVRACVPSPHGAGAVASPCSTPNACRSGLCQTQLGQCTDVCARDADCAGGFRCKVDQYGQLSDGTEVFINVCLPESF